MQRILAPEACAKWICHYGIEVPRVSDRGGGGLQIRRIALSSECSMLSYRISLLYFFGNFSYLECCAHLFRIEICVLCAEHSVILAFLVFDLEFENETAAVRWIFYGNEKNKDERNEQLATIAIRRDVTPNDLKMLF